MYVVSLYIAIDTNRIRVMLEVVARHLKDVSVLRRLLFAASNLSNEVPNFWGIVVEFATRGKVHRNRIDQDTAAALVENIHEFDERAFESDTILTQQLVTWTPTSTGKPLGLVLITSEKTCAVCGKTPSIRRDRPASITIYDDSLGRVPGSHFHKICSSKTCDVTQYYGYYTTRGQSFFNYNWKSLQYFVSSSLTAFSVSMLKRMDIEIVIGQLSYKQIADIFNHVHSCHQDTDG